MRASLAELFDVLYGQLTATRDLCHAQEYSRAREPLRKVMGAASSLFTRLTVLDDLLEEAKFVAEVDRAVNAGMRPVTPAPIPGDTPLPLGPGPGGSPPPRPRKGRGKAT